MAQDFYLDPDALSAATAKMRKQGVTLTEAWVHLKQVLEDHHGCWGDDDIGKSFAENYVDAEAKFKESAGLAADTFPSMAEQLDKSSTTFQSVDEDNVRVMDQKAEAS